jgi:hypothetical protein
VVVNHALRVIASLKHERRIYGTHPTRGSLPGRT